MCSREQLEDREVQHLDDVEAVGPLTPCCGRDCRLMPHASRSLARPRAAFVSGMTCRPLTPGSCCTCSFTPVDQCPISNRQNNIDTDISISKYHDPTPESAIPANAAL